MRSAAELLADAVEQERVRPPDDLALVEREHAIRVEYRTAGKTLAGIFVYRVPTIGERRRIAWLSASLRMGTPRSAFSPEENAFIDAVAYLTVTLIEKPEWASGKGGIDDLDDPRIVLRLHEEGRAHEDRFLAAGGCVVASADAG